MNLRTFVPCKDCQTRFAGCHSQCIKYKDFRQMLEADKKLRNKDQQIRAFMGDYGRKLKAQMSKKDKEKFR